MLSLKTNIILLLLASGYPLIIYLKDKASDGSKNNDGFLPLAVYVVFMLFAFFAGASSIGDKGTACLIETDPSTSFASYLKNEVSSEDLEQKVCVPLIRDILNAYPEVSEVSWQTLNAQIRLLIKCPKNIDTGQIMPLITKYHPGPGIVLVKVSPQEELPEDYAIPSYDLVLNEIMAIRFNITMKDIENAIKTVLAAESYGPTKNEKLSDVWAKLKSISIPLNTGNFIPLGEVAEIRRSSITVTRRKMTAKEFREKFDKV